VEQQSRSALAEHQPELAVVPNGEGGAVEFDLAHVLTGLLRMTWSNRRWLLRWTAAWLLAASVIAFLIPTQFESTVRLMPPKQEGGGAAAMMAMLSSKTSEGIGSLAGEMLGGQGLGSTSGPLFIGILRSRTVQDRLIDRFDLLRVYWTRSRERARKKLADRTDIIEDRKSGIITITVADSNKQRATLLAQAYVDQLDRLVAELTTSSAHRERVFIEGRLTVVKQELEDSEKALSEFSSHNATLDVKDQGRAMLSAAAGLQSRMVAAESELRALQQIYSDNNVRVRSAKARVGELRRQLDKLGAGAAPPVGASQDEEGSGFPSLRQLPVLGVTYADLYRRTKISEAVFENLTKQYEMAKVQEAKEIPSVRVLDHADLPEKKSFPPRLLFMFLGVFLGLVSGMTYLIARENWRRLPSHHPASQLAGDIGAYVAERRAAQAGNED
jgi:capsule polysaccharide export protein KpsE/RkpR